MQVLERKMEDISTVDADLIATGNVGCQLQLRAGMERAGRAHAGATYYRGAGPLLFVGGGVRAAAAASNQ